MAWLIESTSEYDQWFGSLTDAEKTEVLRKVILLEANGPALSRPHADTLTGSAYANMKELRASTATAQLRVAFAFDPNRTAILLCGGQKQGVNQKRFYKQLIALADRLFARHLNKKKG
jgi:hypothetical protein